MFYILFKWKFKRRAKSMNTWMFKFKNALLNFFRYVIIATSTL